MNDRMALNLIAEIMGWRKHTDDGLAQREYKWLRLMSSVKYDGYTDFRAGIRFLETLASWLNQFKPTDRQAAYDFVKGRLIYISPAEMQQIIEAFYAEEVSPRIRVSVAAKHGIRPYEVWQREEYVKDYDAQKRKTLFIGMSDGSRIDILRRINSGVLSTEQVLPVMNVNDEKWVDLDKNLKDDNKGESNPKFDRVYLIEDFTASGTTFLRYVNNEWKGKLAKFNANVKSARDALREKFPLAERYSLHIHHYISSHQAKLQLNSLLTKAFAELPDRSYGSWTLSEGLCLPEKTKLVVPNDAVFLALCNTYYDEKIYLDYKKHCDEAGQSNMKLGYADCALPIVLDHNTPNNSVPLLWADTETDTPMRALFRRRHRHG